MPTQVPNRLKTETSRVTVLPFPDTLSNKVVEKNHIKLMPESCSANFDIMHDQKAGEYLGVRTADQLFSLSVEFAVLSARFFATWGMRGSS